MLSKILVVARYKEDLSWLSRVPDWEHTIVRKGKDLPNQGREPSSFFWAMHKLYPKLKDDDTLAFVQGDPNGNGPFGAREDIIPSLTEVEGFTPLGSWHCVCDGEGRPYHPGLPVKEKYEAWLGRPFPGTVHFTAGGQFLCTGKEIKRHPREFYQALIGEMFEGEIPYVMERLWRPLLSRPSDETPSVEPSAQSD